MAEGIFRKIAGERKLKLEVLSAGIFAKSGRKAAAAAIEAAKEKGVDIKKHRSRQLEREILEDADLVLTMTTAHKNHILEIMPEINGRVYTLKEYARGETGEEMSEFAGEDIANLRRCANEIETELQLLFDNRKF